MMTLEGLHNYRLMQQGSGSTSTPAHKNYLTVPSLCNVRYNDSQEEHRPAQHHPTNRVYAWLEAAFDWFNRSLFEDELPPCLLTFQRRRKAYGFFAGDRFANKRDAREITDEIALNPHYFAHCSPEDILSTLVHEMAHHWQHHFGKTSRWGYHNKQWAQKMHSIGLIPSNTGKPGGKETGRRISHYIAEDGPFAPACATFLAEQEVMLYHDRNAEADDDTTRKEREKKAASKTKFTCAGCGANAWGKADLVLLCGLCLERMEALLQLNENPDRDNDMWSDLKKFALSLPAANIPNCAGREARNFLGRGNIPHQSVGHLRTHVTHQRVRKKM